MAAGENWLKSSLIIAVALTLGCTQSQKQLPLVELKTPAGNMTILLLEPSRHLSLAWLDALQGKCADSINLSFIQQDVSIGFDLPCADSSFSIPKSVKEPLQLLHLRGALFVPKESAEEGCFYIVQGKPLTLSALTELERKNRITYTDEQKQRYIKYGGAPQLDAVSVPFGVVVQGLEVIDKLAAMPTNADRQPLQPISAKSVEVVVKK